MRTFLNLSNTETEIMNLLWQITEPLSLCETVDYLNKNLNKNWKQQTVGTYLSHLQKNGLIHIDKRFAKSYLYFPACTKEEYIQKCIKQLVADSFDNSIINLVSAFTGGQKLSKTELEELQKLI